MGRSDSSHYPKTEYVAFMFVAIAIMLFVDVIKSNEVFVQVGSVAV